MPKTKLGRWAMWLAAGFIIGLILSTTIAWLFDAGTETNFVSKYILPVIAISALLSGLATFFTGLYSIIKQKERAVITFITTFIGFFVLLLIIGEFALLH